jgi:putative transposase
MIWCLLMQCFSILLQGVLLRRRAEREKDLEILLLRRQLAMMEHKQTRPLRMSRVDRLTLAVLTVQFKTATGWSLKQLAQVVRVFQPETVLKWHRELVRRKWTFQQSKRGGRPPTPRELERLIVRLAKENLDWGNGKIQGELLKLGFEVSDETVANILRRHGIPPVPERCPSPSWQNLMTHYKEQILACDFFTVGTLFLQTLYVLFFIELSTRRVYLAGCTTHPTSGWVTQQARQITWDLEERTPTLRFLIHDRDTQFTNTFDTVFRAEGMHIIRTPVRAPNATAFAERWVRTVRHECLNKLLIVTESHLRRVLGEYVTYYNQARPHQGLAQHMPVPRLVSNVKGPVRCPAVLAGIVHDYYREAA